MEGSKIVEYVQRFHDLSQVASHLVEPEFKRIERFIGGLAPQILSLVTTSKPSTITDAIDLSMALTEEAVRLGKFSTTEEKKEIHVELSGDNKRKFANFKKGTRVNSKNRAKKGKEYGKYENCGKVGHVKETCRQGTERGNGGQDGSKNLEGNNDNNDYQGRKGDKRKRAQGCFNCGSKKHFRRYCPKNNQAQG
ncbi:uncharacterized protein LOC110933332 [Helianthus annuus]|uniref:uncharacterized protein LOC110933332 n=1 Tax=Helianthus annuus TaxID=4232 RepID=UPI000B8F3CB7|nr:uncharacterized protein LOC110933332 [Helianthus annuus]